MTSDELVQAMVGGAFIGLAGGLLLLIQGRVMGVSGIVSQSLRAPKQSAWRLYFLLGLVTAPLILSMIEFNSLPLTLPTSLPLERWQILFGAVLVGVGTRIGSGCTSGHGVCGVGRLSTRSIVATLIFMLTAMVTTYATRHVLV